MHYLCFKAKFYPINIIMHQSIKQLPKLFVADTNVLLNACFVEDSLDRNVLNILKINGYVIIIDDSIEREAKRVLERLMLKNALDYNPQDIFTSFINSLPVFHVGNTPHSVINEINKADQHISSIARHYSSWILTGDLKFAAECHSAGVAVRILWDILMGEAMDNGREPRLEDIIRVSGLSKIQGSFFARVIPGAWAGTKDIGLFFIVEAGNVGSLFYDTKNDAWTFQILGNHALSLKCSLKLDEEWIICGSYKFQGKSGNATLRAFNFKDVTKSCSVHLNTPLMAQTPGEIIFGQSTKKDSSWNGYIKCMVVSPQPMTKYTWNAVSTIPYSAPNPYCSDILENALKALRISGMRFFIPTETYLKKSWII